MHRRSLLALLSLSAAFATSSPRAGAQTYVKASNPGAMDHAGWAVAISSDTIAVGAQDEDSNAVGLDGGQSNNSALDAGAVYVYTGLSGLWSQQAYVKASNTGSMDKFGATVALSGDTLVVGAPGEDSSASGVNGNQLNELAPSAGAVYVFVRSGALWVQQAYIKASNPETNDGFGLSVSLSGETLVVGALGEDSSFAGVNANQLDNAASGAGAAYVFVRSGTVWTQQAYLKAGNPAASDAFGTGVHVSGDTIIVGAPGEDSSASGVNGDASSNAAPSSGAAYVFARSGGTWSQQAYLKASNTEGGDAFGGVVSLSGDTAVVGAAGEDSDATGVNGSQAFDSAPGAGSAYVFVRSGGTWSQQAYLKASNTDSLDQFGGSVAVSGDRIVVGASSEAGNAVGVNGDQSSDALVNAGAAYTFVRSGGSWSQQAYLKASNTDDQDFFGLHVAVSGNTVVVGSYREDSNATGVDGVTNESAMDSGASYVFGLPAASAWTDMGSGLAGIAGVPSLAGSGTLTGGSVNAIDLSSAAPSAPAVLFIALAGTPTAFKGGTLLPVPALALISLATGPAGAIPLPFLMPAGVPGGTQLWMQWAIHDAAALQGASLSNAVRGVTP